MAKRLIALLPLLDAAAGVNSVVPQATKSSEFAKPHGAFKVAPPRETGQVGVESDYTGSPRQSIDGRQEIINQIPFNFCPEDFGRPPKLCDACGGDSYHHGICNRILLSGRQTYNCITYGAGCQGYFCKCTHDGEDHNPQITSTTVIGGQTGTVIYEPLTLTQYSDLRYRTTVTLTEVATATYSDDAGGMETALAVIFAGGIAWVAVSETGGAAAIAAIEPPSQKPEDAKDDDKSCKRDPEEDCPDCGGSDGYGLCSSGDQAGCPCEEKQNCPNEPPRCADPQCGGDCSASGEINGCTCCPDTPPLCSNQDCIGGSTQLCTEAKWEECGCLVEADAEDIDEGDDSGGITNPSALSASISSVAGYVFTAVWDANYTRLIGYPTSTHDPTPSPSNTAIADGVDLRVLPIGDSITWGAQSSDDNGYRESLFNQLAARGNDVDFVGRIRSGSMADNQHEGHRGKFIEEIGEESYVGIGAAANIVLLHAGTNDCNKSIDVDTAPERLGNLIDLILDHSSDAVVLVCQIIPSKRPDTQIRIKNYNDAIPDIVDKFVEDGKKVYLVDMNSALTQDDLADDLHPNDQGYAKMADTYYDAINAVDEKGWITEPGEPDSTSPDACASTPSWYYEGQIADGAKVATSDGDFKPGWVKKGVVAEGACDREQLHFMDLDGDGLKDYACVDPDTGATKVHLNIPDADGKTSGNWNPLGTIATGKKGRNGKKVFFGDLNGDGRDDYIYVDSDTGELFGWINRLQNADGVWLWESLGVIGTGFAEADGQASTEASLYMADLDGDGRDDLLYVVAGGETKAWLNTGADKVPDYYRLDEIATGATAALGDTVYFGDFTGEGRADYMIVGDGGKVYGLVNRLQETTLAPRWLGSFVLAEGPDGAEQDEVRLVDMTGDGKVDYLLVGENGKVTLWENIGTGGKYQPGEGVVLCDLDGDGTSDYFWLDEKGRGWGYLNIGKGSNAWQNLGQIANGPVRDRNLIRMGVLTHSKRADYILVEEDTGRATWWQNLGLDWDWGWASQGVAATGPRETIENTYGWKFTGKNVRFADLDGDGYDDYLYVNDQGAVVMWKNLGTNPISWGLPHLVADGVGVLARQVQFADTNGDGLLDYVVVGSVSGNARSWHHLGFRDDDSIRWNTPLSFADGVGVPGRSIRITEMTGDDRADYVTIDPDTGRLNLWHNRCLPI
ncbi:hypothetical protein O1611_g6011 [Lasiodiplodia mahajangana]|uniref:Uncharacterized protein n=1 Tax=Lasiodiplodia mahajangana TaxID=1108764 RepID=A0ACC2JJD2_9PEZI|nr:hypothetical protein O1611_g6011 [Lasiodiplodia mahajangana]